MLIVNNSKGEEDIYEQIDVYFLTGGEIVNITPSYYNGHDTPV